MDMSLTNTAIHLFRRLTRNIVRQRSVHGLGTRRDHASRSAEEDCGFAHGPFNNGRMEWYQQDYAY